MFYADTLNSESVKSKIVNFLQKFTFSNHVTLPAEMRVYVHKLRTGVTL